MDGQIVAYGKGISKTGAKVEAARQYLVLPQLRTQSKSIPNTQSESIPDNQSESISDTQSEAIPDTQSEAIPDTHSESISDTQSESIPDGKHFISSIAFPFIPINIVYSGREDTDLPTAQQPGAQ